jgi:hypothetical protein
MGEKEEQEIRKEEGSNIWGIKRRGTVKENHIVKKKCKEKKDEEEKKY